MVGWRKKTNGEAQEINDKEGRNERGGTYPKKFPKCVHECIGGKNSLGKIEILHRSEKVLEGSSTSIVSG